MKTYALLNENQQVINIGVFDDDAEIADNWAEYGNDNPAIIGGDYVDGYFYSPQPFASWTRNQGKWICPKPRPDGHNYWDEGLGEWVEHETIPETL